jgi:hypothetical protein
MQRQQITDSKNRAARSAMTSTAAVEDLQFRLLLIEALLNTTADGIRHARVAPVRENIRYIDDAIAAIRLILDSIYAMRPDLMPAAFERSLPPIDL